MRERERERGREREGVRERGSEGRKVSVGSWIDAYNGGVSFHHTTSAV